MSREWIRFPLNLMVHPFEGYWDLKYDRNRKFTLIISFCVLFLVAVTNILGSQYSGFLVHVYNPESMNSVMEIVYVIVPILFWCVANWSLTTLMDGEGKFVEIFTSTCFALLPLVIIQFPWIGSAISCRRKRPHSIIFQLRLRFSGSFICCLSAI